LQGLGETQFSFPSIKFEMRKTFSLLKVGNHLTLHTVELLLESLDLLQVFKFLEIDLYFSLLQDLRLLGLLWRRMNGRVLSWRTRV